MSSKKRTQVFPCIATNNGVLVNKSLPNSRRVTPRSRRISKVVRKGLNCRDAGINPLAPRDLLDAALGNASVCCDLWPLPLAFLQLIDNVTMDGFRHIAEDKPVYGLMQPENGRNLSVRFLVMPAGRPKKVSTPKDIIGQILTDNVRARWARAFPNAANDTDRLEALARRAGVGKETLRMALRGDQSPRIDTVDRIARALGTTCDVLLKAAPEDEAAA